MSEGKTKTTDPEPSMVVVEAHNIGEENLMKACLTGSELMHPLETHDVPKALFEYV